MARRICALAALAALARAYDWTTPDAGLTPFNCTAFPNPIQVLLPDGQSPPYNVSELDLATGRYVQRHLWDARRATPSPFLADVLYAFPAARNGGHYSGSPFTAPSRPRFQPYHGRRLPPATQRRPPPPAFGSRGRRLGRRRFAMFTGGLVDADDDAFADFDDY